MKNLLKDLVISNLDFIIKELNNALNGNGLNDIEDSIVRLSRNSDYPYWYNDIQNGFIPNADGKTIGSIIENLLTAIIEVKILKEKDHNINLKLNPARGVDIPQLDLGIKSPSENFCTSEPFFSAYERLIGNEYDAIILLTDYQTKKKISPLRINIIDYVFLKGSQIADKNLCVLAKKQKDYVLNIGEPTAKKFFKFLAYVNQSDWLARKLLELFEIIHLEDEIIIKRVNDFAFEYNKKNGERKKKHNLPLSESYLEQLNSLIETRPLDSGIINLADNWVIQEQREFARVPNDNEWERLINSPLDGKIGISMALQWRFNFGMLFKK
jgi:hypothetical protein